MTLPPHSPTDFSISLETTKQLQVNEFTVAPQTRRARATFLSLTTHWVRLGRFRQITNEQLIRTRTPPFGHYRVCTNRKMLKCGLISKQTWNPISQTVRKGHSIPFKIYLEKATQTHSFVEELLTFPIYENKTRLVIWFLREGFQTQKRRGRGK